MKSSYKPIGPYIQVVDIRNIEDKKENLLGVSVAKCFIPSIANTVGTNFKTYRVVKKNQFTYIPDTSRRGDKIGVALLENEEEGLVSQAYTVFEIWDKENLLPEYLMMWFRRPEFDRYARYISHGSVREIFSWEDMCNVSLPIPSPEKQREIVAEYNVIQNRIKLNNQLIQKLEETAQAIYKQWFVDFEFPDENGLPYKSNGGKMVFNEELDKEIPGGWEVGSFSQIMEITSGKTPSNKNDLKDNWFQYPIYGAGGIMGYSSEYLFNERMLSMGRVGTHGVIQRINFPCWASDNTLILFSKYYEYTNQILLNINYDEINRGGVQGLITQTDIKNTRILIPENNVIDLFEKLVGKIMCYSELNKTSTEKTIDLNDLLLSKLATIEN